MVGVSAGIAAYKAVLLVRELRASGAEVQVVLTPNASRFVGPITFGPLSGRPVLSDFWEASSEREVHVELGAWADAMVVAPATMNLLTSAASGRADNLVLATMACSRGPIVVAPAMHSRMWQQPATQRAVAQLRADGVHFVGPVDGPLANGDSGLGRMAEPLIIAEALAAVFDQRRDWLGRRVVVTAGPTVEDLDPVRFLGNRSSGRMGYALAATAARRGAEVLLISGPVELPIPDGVKRVGVRTALEMRAAVQQHAAGAAAVIMAAAVSDYRPTERSSKKLKKGDDTMTLQLTRNPDILAELGEQRRQSSVAVPAVLVGFAVETDNLVESARRKLIDKGVDLVVANPASLAFGGEANCATLVEADSVEELPQLSKTALADRILDRALRWIS